MTKVALARQKGHAHAHTYTWDTEQYHACDSGCVCVWRVRGCLGMWGECTQRLSCLITRDII